MDFFGNAIRNFYGALTVNGAPGFAPLTLNPAATQRGLLINMGDSASVGLNIQDPGGNATQVRINTNNTQVVMQALGAVGTTMNFTTQNVSNAMVLQNGALLSGATGGDQGTGTLNAQGLFINSDQLFFGVPASANTTAAVSDVGKVINAAGTITIPNAVFSQGHALSIYNNTAASITITATITTMRLAGTATTGSRTLAARGIATIWFESGTECVVGGPGVT